jgi:hypothetical protein
VIGGAAAHLRSPPEIGKPLVDEARADGQWRPLASIAELKAWLDQGPLLMDGARWFGERHWFVGIGYDAGGVYIRDSSGWDNRYLSWSQLYGEWTSAAG